MSIQVVYWCVSGHLPIIKNMMTKLCLSLFLIGKTPEFRRWWVQMIAGKLGQRGLVLHIALQVARLVVFSFHLAANLIVLVQFLLNIPSLRIADLTVLVSGFIVPVAWSCCRSLCLGCWSKLLRHGTLELCTSLFHRGAFFTEEKIPCPKNCSFKLFMS